MKKKIQKVAKEIYENMEWRERENREKYCCLKNDVEWQRDIIFKAHDNRLPDDDIYSVINEVLGVLSDLSSNIEENEIYKVLYQIEPSCYTSELTGWLNRSIYNVYYLDEAINMGATDGFQILALAWDNFKNEIGNNLINAIEEYIEESD